MKLKSKNSKRKTIIIVSIVAAVVLLVTVGVVILLTRTPIGSLIVNSDKVTSIMVSRSPDTLTYYIGQPFDPTGLKIQTVGNSNEAIKIIDGNSSELKFSGFDSSVANDKVVITVTYQDFSTMFTVKVKEWPPEDPVLESVRLSEDMVYSLKMWRKYGPIFDTVKLICKYTNGTEVEVPMLSTYCSGIDREITSAGTTEFKIRYTDEYGTTVETTVTVTITN